MTLPQGRQLAGGKRGQARPESQAHCTPLPHTEAALDVHPQETVREDVYKVQQMVSTSILQTQTACYML